MDLGGDVIVIIGIGLFCSVANAIFGVHDKNLQATLGWIASSCAILALLILTMSGLCES